MTLSTQLWSENSDLASEALTHPFVCRLGDGSLAREISTGYLAQDAFFLESFARAYALAIAHSPDTPTLLALADLLAGVREELGLHASYAARWGIDGKLIDFGKRAEVPMRDLALELLEFVDDVVDELESRDAVEYVHTVLREGTSADRQLAVFRETGDLGAVVRHIVNETRGTIDLQESHAT